MAKHRQTKATDITPEVKAKVFARDGSVCIICGSCYGLPNAHYIPRSHGGLGIEQNIVTLCPTCHYRFDNTTDRSWMKLAIADYLRSKYDNWCEKDLYYKKYGF